MAKVEDQTLLIDGRKFHGVTQELSAAQDDYIVGQLRLAGVLGLLSHAKTDEEAEAAAEAMLTQILVSGRAAQVLAGCLTEEGKQWTLAAAMQNADVFSSTTNADDKRAMRDAIVGFILGFFLFGTASATTSQKSSNLN